MHEAMDAQTVADLLGVSTRQLNNYINLKDLPCIGSGRNRTFNWPDVREWFVAYRMQLEMGAGNGGSDDVDFDDPTSDSDGPRKKEDIRQANLRRTIADANIKELALSVKRREVINIADAVERVNRMMGNLRSKLLSMPSKLTARLEGEVDRTAKEAALRDEMEKLCIELSTGEVVGLNVPDPQPTPDFDDEPGELDDLTAAADTYRRRTLAEALTANVEGLYDSL